MILTPEVIKKGNRIIASFVGTRYTLTLDYHTNYNSLMPVIKKITNQSEISSESKDIKNAYNTLCSNLFIAEIEYAFIDTIAYIEAVENKRY